MSDAENRDSDPSLSPREQAHLRARDRKRSTVMVVDNAGVKRILQARQARAAARKAASGAGRETAGARNRG
jgi:nanoRNase/pAp phosphatase (c-di-AMP/oligoRNAs hydrolase)